MSLFVCAKCGCIENTACCRYWMDKIIKKMAPVCSECDTNIGKWHGKFEKRSAIGMLIDQSGGLWSQESIDRGALPPHYQIVGKVGA